MQKPVARTLAGLIDGLAIHHPERPAVTSDGRTLTFDAFRAEAIMFAKALHAAGVKKGDKVGLLMGNRIEWLVACFGIQYVGATLVALNTWYTPRELSYVLQQAQVGTLLTIDHYLKSDYSEMLEAFRPWKETFPELERVAVLGDHVPAGATGWNEFLSRAAAVDDAVIAESAASVGETDMAYLLFTSGSTAHPKGVMLEHGHLIDNTWDVGARLHFVKDDVMYFPIALFWGLGCENMLLACWSRGMHIVLQDAFDPCDALALIERYRCTAFCGTPNIVQAVFEHPDRNRYDLSSLQKGVAAGSPEATRDVIENYLPMACHCYGLTECYGFATVNDASDPIEKRCVTEGKPTPGIDLIIVDPETDQCLPDGEVGEVRLKGHVTRGYYNNPAANADSFDANGYFKTGDLGALDEGGYLLFKGRLKEMLKTGGMNVAPVEVEEVLRQHPAVREAFVTGIKDAVREEIVAAIIILSEGRSITEDEVKRHCRKSLAAYKVPRRVLFTTMDKIPQTTTAKIHRLKLATLFEVEEDFG